MNVASTFIAHPQSSELMQPTDGPFHHPAHTAQVRVFVSSPVRNARLNTLDPQHQPLHQRIVGLVGPQTSRNAPRTARLARNRGNGVYQGLQLLYITAVRRGDAGGEGYALASSDNVVFGTAFPAIGRVRANLVPPKTARTELLSTMAFDKSSRSARRNSDNRHWWIFSQIPPSCQSRSRRQQVIPHPQPISFGRSCQAIPVLSTNAMPVNARRFSIGGRPPFRRGGRCCIKGSTKLHSPSAISSLAIRMSSMTKPIARAYRHTDGDSIRFCYRV